MRKVFEHRIVMRKLVFEVFVQRDSRLARNHKQLEHGENIRRAVIKRSRRQQNHLSTTTNMAEHFIRLGVLVAEPVGLIHNHNFDIVPTRAMDIFQNFLQLAAASHFPIFNIKIMAILLPPPSLIRAIFIAHKSWRTNNQTATPEALGYH